MVEQTTTKRSRFDLPSVPSDADVLAKLRVALPFARLRRFSKALAMLAVSSSLLLIAGCAGGPSLPKITDLNPFKKKEEILPGKRVAILAPQERTPGELAPANKPIALPAVRNNLGWTQPGGEPSNAPGHLALKQVLRVAFRANAGTGSSKYGRLLASPIVYEGRVYTLDSEGRVTAFSTSGKKIWSRSLLPKHESAHEGFGGGLAADDGRIYAATGFGIAYALDPKSGKPIWQAKVGVPVRSSPTAAGGKLYLVGADGRFFCLNGPDGTQVWGFRGLPQTSRILSNVSPAVAGNTVIVPYPSGEIVALRMDDGQAVWTESLTRSSRRSNIAAMSDPGRPVIVNGVLYAVGHAGRMIATNIKTGDRLWAINVPGIQTPWVAGDNVFVVDTSGNLMALDAKTGQTRWQVNLPGSNYWSGPVLAGSRLWLVSKNGRLISVDAGSGRVTSKQSLGSKVYIAPVVAGGRMYVMADDARLIGLQ